LRKNVVCDEAQRQGTIPEILLLASEIILRTRGDGIVPTEYVLENWGEEKASECLGKCDW